MSMTKTVKEVSAATPGSPLRGLCWCECRDRRILRKMIGRRRAGEERRREERGWRGSETRMLMRVRRRKEEGRENIDLRQENRRECNRRGLYPAWTVIRSEEGDTAAGYSAPISADISVRVCVFCTCIPGGEGRRTRQRREEKMLWSATCRDVERERRESQGGGGRRYVKKRCLFCGEYAFHLEVLWECGGRVINRTVWRSPETSGGVGFFDRRRERDGRSSRRWS